MTFRLVGLMSLVLLLSLAAFALLMNSYQADVMDEVTQTVSTVGKATLRSIEIHHGPPSKGGTSPQSGGVVSRNGFAYELHTEALDYAMKPAAGKGVAIIHLGRDCGPGKPCDAGQDDPGRMVVVRLEEVRAESDPARGTVLKIPTWKVATKSGATPFDAGGADTRVVDAPGAVSSFKETRQDIVLPIPTHEFQDLFAAFRKRTLLLFLGVFVVGTLLSASLASRFTRPVRRLDAGIRRLTEGDLDVRVEAGGRDEIGRLSRAFNEMASRLRAGRERERELRRREKLSALGRLAAGVAHDVRNPLHSMGLTLQNLQETARPTEMERGREFDRSLAIIRDEIRRLDRLVENFLRFARSDRAARMPVDLARLARETTQLVEKEAERRGIRLRVVAEEEAAAIEGDVESIRSSILNLVLNSFEAMPEGGSLTLTLRGAEGEVLLEVADTGRGIPEADQEKVFDFAYTTREDGHGLGLAMVHQVVVEDHGGRVSLESRPGEGTRVVLAFPLGASAPRTEAAS
ncbi:MAG TPA: HAMP domain-containing sensor histidine kinase [Candidatus Polarisedimenticolia bacterium]|nr:HAMP domain-containing sensor histidine kinase [Candidatus Polarisedimenticolia bacterium]